jgi:hypothetical protein
MAQKSSGSSLAKSPTPVSLDELPAFVPLPLTLRVVGFGRTAFMNMVRAGLMPRPVRPAGNPRGRLYFKRDELIAAIKRLA